MHRMRLRSTAIACAAGLAATVGFYVFGTGAVLAAATTRYVSTTGHDVGNCANSAAPCATLQYAVNQAAAGDTVKVAAGTYHQTVAITKAVSLVGAGAGTTTLDGHGLDTAAPYYGIVYVGAVGGTASVSGFTITNPYPYSYTGGEPEAVALADPTASDSVVINLNAITEGTVDANRGSDFPIGIDTFKNYAHTTITNNVISGTFQGALLEDNGPVAFNSNVVKNLISGTQSSTVYPAEGVFFLSDLAGSLTNQNALGNTFKLYAGYGLIMEAGYNNGNCSSTPCNGSIAGTISNNTLALGGATGAAGIVLQAEFAGNHLTAYVNHNQGYVTHPDHAIIVKAAGGATATVTEDNNSITVH